MARDTPEPDEPPKLQTALDLLDDPDCRAIMEHLDEPMTAEEVSETVGLPQSTAYRKLHQLSNVSFVDERMEIRSDGHHTTRYVNVFERFTIELGDQGFEASVDRRTRTADQRLADLWSEMRRET